MADPVEHCAPRQLRAADRSLSENFEHTNAYATFSARPYGEDTKALLARVAWVYVDEPLFTRTAAENAIENLDATVESALASERARFPHLA